MPRKVDLLSYLPPVIRDTLEFAQIAQAEEPELNLLYEEAAQTLSDNFILTAGINGIKRYERLLGIVPEVGASLDERRAQVQITWNSQLPYTLKRLTEQLDGWVGQEGYELDTSRFREYILGIQVFEQPLRVLHYVKNMTEQMIPANLELFYQGVFKEEVKTEILYQVNINLNTRFYPRKNLERLLLDNTWKLDGDLKLTGYGTGELEDFYPIRLGVRTEVNSVSKLGILEVTTINQLDAIWKLDGSRRLNGGHEIL